MDQNYEKQPFYQLLRSTRFPKAAMAAGLSGFLITTLVSLAIPLLTRNLVDGFSVASLSTPLIAGIAAAFLLQAVISGLSSFLLSYSGQKVVAELRGRMWRKLLRLPVSHFDNEPSGGTVSRIVNDTGIVRELISDHVPQFVSGIISIIGAVTLLLIMDWKMTLVMLISVPVTVLIMIPLGKRMAKISRGMQDETAAFSGSIQQTISEIRLMKASNAEADEEKKGLGGIGRLMQFGLREAKIISVIGPLMNLVLMAVIVCIIVYGGIRVSSGSMSTGTLVAFLLYLFQIIMPVTSFAMFFTQLQKAKGATERIAHILGLEPEPGQTGGSADIGGKAVTLDRVSFSYSAEEPVLQEISFTANPGEMIAFAGPSGGGKSTLFSLLERFYEPDSGMILVGDVPISELSLESWRRRIGYVAQDSSMMSGTIRDNLLYGMDSTGRPDDGKLWAAAEMAYAAGFIRDFPDGLDTEIGERGIKLSGGQRQRIAIARAFLRDPLILMMDEATASLDSHSEAMVQEALSRLMEGRTTFAIAHRLSTIVDADKIVFIEEGRVTGIGKHKELLKTHPVYRRYAEQQLV
ncbi:ABC transporter ATP-binding protein [Edaphobacillus lindanitolerans]|uniref:ATP-binding cassette, subfamily B, AbcA/BmrA n=1 Tax=Edaphobacillus lindanitolerans TaxID=550447 RepID=A0A1U7PJ44_9BACI|nr:ABC transporter ATP-binding protein [Edaphobacillus lindanitolerans]SIT80302.1 ATP-binding cassette, subfamily B, AbcA/BmrA [Edaphobacillus lindanitolerans]